MLEDDHLVLAVPVPDHCLVNTIVSRFYCSSRLKRKATMWFSTRSDTKRAVEAQKAARDWKVWIKKVDELYYPCSENKEADLRLYFRICRLLVFS